MYQEINKEHYNKNAETAEFSIPFFFDKFSNYVCPTANILDYGCGYGRILNDILWKKKYLNLTGIDFSQEMINRGQASNPEINYICNNKIDFDDNSFDCVILLAVLTCIISKEDQISLIKEIHRVLKPGGFIYVGDYLLNTDERNLSRYAVFKKNNPDSTYGIFESEKGGLYKHHERTWIDSLLKPFIQKEYNEEVYETQYKNSSNGFYYIGQKPIY